MTSGSAAGLLWAANFLDKEADALDTYESAIVDQRAHDD